VARRAAEWTNAVEPLAGPEETESATGRAGSGLEDDAGPPFGEERLADR
jgi:hypothetical protein